MKKNSSVEPTTIARSAESATAAVAAPVEAVPARGHDAVVGLDVGDRHTLLCLGSGWRRGW